MQSRTPVFIVTSSRPRVGKTLLARALTEYFPVQRRPVAAFDVNPDDFRLADCLPGYAAAASLEDTRGEMALFDQLITTDEIPKVLDLGHLMFQRFFAVMGDIDFLGAARRNGIEIMVLFVADADHRARQGYAMVRERLPDLALVPLFNEHLPRTESYRHNFPPTRRGGDPVQVPGLTPVVRSVVDRPGFSFVTYAMKTTDPTAELYDWMRRLFISFRELEVRLLLGGLRPQLRHSA
jgi:hypothetical protein